MMDIVFFVGFIIVAIRVAASVRAESAIFDEFALDKSLALLVLLFPIGPIALLTLPHRVGWLPAAVVAAACYIPALVNSRELVAAFDCSGTDRTEPALKSAHEAFGAALVGILYVGIFVIMSAGASSIGE